MAGGTPRVVVLLLGVASIAYITALVTTRARSRPRGATAAFWLGIVLLLGILGFFKYADFFASSFASLLRGLGLRADNVTLNVVLPIGISFYVFMAIAYVVDVRRGRIAAMRDPITFFAFSTFFPQLLAGPIGRAPDLLPQYSCSARVRRRRRTRCLAPDALGPRQEDGHRRQHRRAGRRRGAICTRSAAWRSSPSPSSIRSRSTATSPATQTSPSAPPAYSASGSSQLPLPVPRHGVSEFWRRWHITLAIWIRDYVYIPLGGSRV